ncbi:MAG: hypothetical protein V1756_01170, partial [Patescibacteria group bacterium]
DVAGREDMKIRKKVSSEKLAEKVNKSNVEYVPERKLLAFLKNNAKNYDVLVIMGAGDIYGLSLKLLAGR